MTTSNQATHATLQQQIEALHDELGFRVLRAVALEAMFGEDSFDGGVVVCRGDRGGCQIRGLDQQVKGH